MTDPIQIAWAAGLFEGEGSITLRTWTRRCGVRFTLSSTDLDVVQRFHSIVGCGNINGPVTPRPGTKPQWRWAASSADAVVHLAEILGPHLCERRSAKLREVLEAYGSQSPKRHYNLDKTHCPRGHAYEGENILWDEGRRRCRTCEQVRWTRKNAAKRERQKSMGHESSATTEKYYGRVTDLEVARKVASL